MTYTFSKDVLINFDEQNAQLLDKIWFTSNGKHSLYIKNEDEFLTIKNSNWYKGLRKSSQDDIDLQFVNSLNINKNEPRLIISLKEKKHFSLVEALAILEKPLTIILAKGKNSRSIMLKGG